MVNETRGKNKRKLIELGLATKTPFPKSKRAKNKPKSHVATARRTILPKSVYIAVKKKLVLVVKRIKYFPMIIISFRHPIMKKLINDT